VPCPSANPCPNGLQPAADWHGFRTGTQRQVYTPRTRAELVSAVQEIEASGRRAHALGTDMSLSSVGSSDDAQIHTDLLDRHVTVPYGAGAVNWPSTRVRYPQAGPATLGVILSQAARSRNPRIVYIEAGMKIRQLLADLASIPPPGLALPAMGAGGAQSLAGAFGTGTHGSELRLQPLFDQVRAAHIVGPGGREWWIERTNGCTDPDALRRHMPEWCADTQVEYDDRLLYSALVSIGRLGVLYGLVLELEPEYWLAEARLEEPFAEVRTSLEGGVRSGYDSPEGIFAVRNRDKPAGTPPLTFLQVVVQPNDLSRCWIIERRRLAAAATPTGLEKVPFDPIEFFCHPADSQALIGLASGVVTFLGALIDPTVLVPAPPPLIDPVGFFIDWVVGQISPVRRLREFLDDLRIAAAQSENLGDLMSRLLQKYPEFLPAINAAIVAGQHSVPLRVGRSFQIMDQMDYSAPTDCYRGDSTEYFFDARSDSYLRLIDSLYDHARALGGVPGYLSMRFVRQSDATVAMERFPLTVAVEVSILRPWPTGTAFLQEAQRLALGSGGIPHWGQQIYGALDTRRLYGRSLDCFHYAVARLEEGAGPTFSSAFSRRHGLDPTQDAATLHRRTTGERVSVREMQARARDLLHLPAAPESVQAMAAPFAPSLRMNPASVALPLGRCTSFSHGIRLRDLSWRLL
jgi:hypothetical protein